MKRPTFTFDWMELSGSLGDLGTLLPMAIGMIVINGLAPVGVFAAIGLFYILSGVYFRVPVPVQPMKVIGAYAIATAMSAQQVLASGLLMGAMLLFLGGTDLISAIGKIVPRAVIRGVQLATGTLLMAQGIHFMLGTSVFQQLHGLVEPFLRVQQVAGLPIGVLIGTAGGLLTLLLLDSRRLPAGLAVVAGGLALGGVLGTYEGLDRIRPGLHLPALLPFGFPAGADFTFALLALVLPQTPMTVGNAVVANADLSFEYFGADSRRVTYRALTVSMGLANIGCFFVGGMPLCHGAGGLAAHYRFGARTAGSNLLVGGLFLAAAFLLGPHAPAVVHLMPMAVLGVLLVFAGSQLALTIADVRTRKDLFVVVVMLGITLASNLAAGFLVGIALCYALRSDRLKI